MIKKTLLFVAIFVVSALAVSAQTGTIKGKIFNSKNNEPIPFANVVLEGTTIGATSDIDGKYKIENVSPGIYNVLSSYIGFKKKVIYEIQVSTSRPSVVDIAMEEDTKLLNEVVVAAPAFNKTEESPVSIQTIGVTEISRSPGGNRDISKVIQSLPGVATGVSFRNDIIIRGGAPNENRFYLDGIEVPNINHFATQGSSGGPVGMINVNFIREVDFYTGAFPASRGNMLSSLMDLKQKEGNNDNLATSVTLGSSDMGLTFDGPVTPKSNFIFSARQSYLQFLFQALGLPFLPTYNDFQFKGTYEIDKKNKITLIGLGAIDNFKLNEKVNDNLSDPEVIERNNYILGYLPVNNQWNYASGIKWQRFTANGGESYIVSRNHLSNSAVKYKDNIKIPANLILNYKSQEIENKFRFEKTITKKGWKFTYGTGYEYVTYTNSTYNKVNIRDSVVTIDYDSKLNFGKYSVFTQGSRTIFHERVVLSAGLRTDFSDYSKELINPVNQLSPRISLSYKIKPKWFLNFNSGYYSQLPPYTVLGYRDAANTLINKQNKITYINCLHFVGGVEYNPSAYTKFTVEGFSKTYAKYPFLLKDSISLANLGADFGVIGNEPAVSTSTGRSYGFEFFAQQKLIKNFYGLLAYTFVRSEFKDKKGIYVPSSWDYNHIVSAIIGKKFKHNWETGIKFRYSGGAPYTLVDVQTSSLKTVWDVNNIGIPDYNYLNQARLKSSHGMDIRIDKKWFFKKWSLNFYVDVQNAYAFKTELPSYLNVEKDANGKPITDPSNPAAYKTYFIKDYSGTVLPSIGMMIEF